MKTSKRGKRILALAMSAFMSFGTLSAFANTVSIDSIKVLNGKDDATGTSYTSGSAVSLTPEQLLEVTVKLTPNGGETLSTENITFLSFENGAETLTNKTIQFVEQSDITVDEYGNGTAKFVFRPRLAVGDYTVKAGGTNVSEAASFEYSVKEAVRDMTIQLSPQSITVGDSVTVTLKSGEDAVTGATVKATPTSGEAVTATGGENGTYTFSNLAAGTYTVTAECEGYTKQTTTLVVNAKAAVEIPEGDKEAVEGGLDTAVDNIASIGTDEITLSGSVTAGSGGTQYDVSYTIGNTEVANKVTITDDNKLKLNEGQFGAKVVLKAKIGNIETEKTVYLVKDGGDKVSFGNLELISDAEGKDAFDDDTSFQAAVEINSDKFITTAAEILNIAIGKGKIDNVPKGAVDINLDGEVTLAEYMMFKCLISTSEDDAYYVPSNFAAARQNASANN